MPRLARVKIDNGGAYYHICSRIAGMKGEYPLDSTLCRRTLLEFIQRFAKVYCCKVVGFCIMGNHYHLVIWFDERQSLSREELRKRASLLYPETLLKGWLKANWERFEVRLFDVSEYMRNLQAAFARWFNQRFGRRGRFWADRFKSTLLESDKQVRDCLLYVELNPVRAGLVEYPEDYEGSSLFHRLLRKDHWMMSINPLVGQKRRAQAILDYKAMIYYRGNVPSKQGQAAIPDRIIREEEARGFKSHGVYKKRLGYFVDGIALGSERYIRDQIERLRETGQYLRRKHPISQLGGIHVSLREQRGVTVGY